MGAMSLRPWSIRARNLPEHADNPIHTDDGARAAGFEFALVAGVTSYAYALHPVIEHFGDAWLSGGMAEVRLRSPVFDGDDVSFPLNQNENGTVTVEARIARLDRPALTVIASLSNDAACEARPGERLSPVSIPLVGEYGSTYAERAGDDFSRCRELGLVHPAVWPALANYVFHRQLARGSWVHTRSIIRHHAAVPEGGTAEVAVTVVERLQRGGERAVADVVISVDGRVVATLEHEAIIDLSPAEA